MRLGALLLVFATVASPHDLEDNRATLVLRDKTHLSLTLFVDYPAALHRTLQPRTDYSAFVVHYSGMKVEDLRKELLRAQGVFEAGTQVVPKGSGAATLRFTAWTWPDAQRVQAMLQHQVMQAVVEGHVHENPTEIHAEAVSSAEITALSVRLPREFQKVLVVSYRPNQTWLDGQGGTADVRF